MKRYLHKDKTQTTLQLSENFSGEVKELKQYNADEAHKLLGVLTDPSSGNKQQVLYMKNQSHAWGRRMRGSYLQPQLKLLSFRMELRLQLRYPLPAVALTKKQLENVMAPARVSIKHALGLCQKTPTESIFFPAQYGGYGAGDLHLTMLSTQARYTAQHLRNNDLLGRRVKIIMETHQLESGLSTCFERGSLEKTASYMTRSLILDLLLELHHLGIHLNMEHWVPQDGGPTIMECLVNEKVCVEDLIKANRCRMWVKVHSIGDLALCDGTGMHSGYVEGKQVRASKWKWPKWEPPPGWNATWTAILATNIRHKVPVCSELSTHQVHRHRIDLKSGLVYGEDETLVQTTRLRRPRLEPCRKVECTKEELVPCDVWASNGTRYLMATGRSQDPKRSHKIRTRTFKEDLLANEPALGKLLSKLPTEPNDCEAIAGLMEEGELVIGSDGSAGYPDRAAFYVLIASQDLTTMYSSSHETLGHPCDSGRA